MTDKKPQTHHCYHCGEETEDWDKLPNGRKLYICGRSACIRDFQETCREVEAEAQSRADDDNYSRYY